jgi:hypothetical protein
LKADRAGERYGEIVFVIRDGKVLKVQRKDGWKEEEDVR